MNLARYKLRGIKEYKEVIDETCSSIFIRGLV